MSQTPARRRWTVRAGITGSGRNLFEAYAGTMEEARVSVLLSAEESGDPYLQAAIHYGFTVHALDSAAEGAGPLARNTYAQIPAPDFPRELATA